MLTRRPGRLDGWKVGRWLLLTAILPTVGHAQAVLNQFSYDNLRPSAIQFDIGLLSASQLSGSAVGGMRLDYGYIAPKIRVLLGASYFKGQLDRDTRNRFEERLRNFVIDPSGDDTIRVGRIYWSTVVIDLDLQYAIPQGRRVTTYLGLGVGVQMRNGSGTLIDDTFVEDALDQLAAAGNVSLSVETMLAGNLRWVVDARGAVSVGLSTVSLRTGLAFRFGGAGK